MLIDYSGQPICSLPGCVRIAYVGLGGRTRLLRTTQDWEYSAWPLQPIRASNPRFCGYTREGKEGEAGQVSGWSIGRTAIVTQHATLREPGLVPWHQWSVEIQCACCLWTRSMKCTIIISIIHLCRAAIATKSLCAAHDLHDQRFAKVNPCFFLPFLLFYLCIILLQ